MKVLSWRLALYPLAMLAVAAGGCRDGNRRYLTADRLDRGLVIILPGIEGESRLNHEIRKGLEQSGLYCAMPIHRWGRPIPIAGPLINQVDVLGNRLAGRRVARQIVDYLNTRPGRPVYLVGHSGGGGIAVFAAESLPTGYQVDGVVLLSASLSADYDLAKAIRHSRQGLVNFHSRADVGLLVVGTMLAGNVDGVRGPGAGAYGFKPPKNADPRAYGKLYQFELGRPAEKGLVAPLEGFLTAHASATQPEFVARYVAPWIISTAWPPPGQEGLVECPAGTCVTSAPATMPAGENLLPVHGPSP